MKLKDKINQARMLMDTVMIQAHKKVAPEYIEEGQITDKMKKEMYNNLRKWSIILILIIMIVIVGLVLLL